jgi:aminopeptidase N
MQQIRDWAIDRSDQGPVHLGYRLGHVRGDSRIFRAVVYNKSAAALHMLRRFIGDEAFFKGLRRFYAEGRFRHMGSEDLRKAMEIESGRSLERFFENWIYGADIPQLTYSYVVHTAPQHAVAIRLAQPDNSFDVPVTMTLEFENRSTRDVVIPLTEAQVEVRIPLDAPLRSVRPSERDGTLAEVRRVSY